MLLDPQRIPTREKLILTGLYLSKFESAGYRKLGFETFIEAFNVIGYALGQKPASIKNYRDEFDPLLPNKRRGWHKRSTRDYCLKIFNEYKDLDLETFAGLVRAFAGYDENAWSEVQSKAKKPDGESLFAKRLITGRAAEQYFESIHPTVAQFKGCAVEDTTRIGCGYDFRLHPQAGGTFLAVEVKGMKEKSGSVSMTPKEHEMAAALANRFFLFVVKNFRKKPYHVVYQNPLSAGLIFKRKAIVIEQVSWLTVV